MMNLPIYPHLGMTEAQLAEICEELFAADPVLAKYLQAIADYEANLLVYGQREQDYTAEINRLDARIDEINAELKATNTLRGDARGAAASNKYHIKMATVRLREVHTRMERRKKQLYLGEARKRLGALGKELKLGIGGYRAGRGLGTAVVDKKPTQHENQSP